MHHQQQNTYQSRHQTQAYNQPPQTYINEHYYEPQTIRRNRSFSQRRVYAEPQAQPYLGPNYQEQVYVDPRRTHLAYTEHPQETVLSTREHVDNLGLTSVEKENAYLKKELHRLRKVEASFLNGQKTKVVEKIHTENHHYLNEKQRLERDIQNFHYEREKMLRDLDALTVTNEELKSHNSALETQIKDLQLQNKKLKELNAHQLTTLKANLQETHRNQLNTHQTEARQRIQDLEDELAALRLKNQQLFNKHDTFVRSVDQKQSTMVKSSQQHLNAQADLDRLRKENQALKDRIQNIEAQFNNLRNENYELTEEVRRYQTNVYEVPTENVDYDAIIAKYKNLLAQKEAEIRALKEQLENLKDEIHRVNIKYQELQVRSEVHVDNGEVKRLEFELGNLRDQLAYREKEIAKLNGIIKNAQNQVVEKKVVVNEYRSDNAQPIRHVTESNVSGQRVLYN